MTKTKVRDLLFLLKILSWICRGDLAQYSPTAQLAALVKRLEANPSPSNSSGAFAASPLINLDPPEEQHDDSLHSSCLDAPISHLASSTGVTELTTEAEKVDSRLSYAQSVDYRLHVWKSGVAVSLSLDLSQSEHQEGMHSSGALRRRGHELIESSFKSSVYKGEG